MAFTLVELLVAIGVIAILASSLLFAMFTTIDDAKTARTEAQITKLNELLMTRWEKYQTRAVRLTLPGAARRWPTAVAEARLNALRDLMRFEMPDRKTDVIDGPTTITVTYMSGNPPVQQQTTVNIARPAVSREYLRRVNAVGSSNWTEQYQDSECLYMILASIRDFDGNGLDFLHENEIGDTDEVDTDGDGIPDQIGDGMPEILDAWGRPIAFIRWPAGFVVHPGKDFNYLTGGDDIPSYSMIQPFTVDTNDEYVVSGDRDPFDPLDRDNRKGVIMPGASGASGTPAKYYFNFALYPLVCSGGPDQVWDIVRFDALPSAPSTVVPFDFYRNPPANAPSTWPSALPWPPPRNDPYSILPASGRRLGEPFLDSAGYADNITNHAIGG